MVINKPIISFLKTVDQILKTILLVDDDSMLLELFSEVLSDTYSVLTATSLVEALELIESNDVDAVVSDHHLGQVTSAALFSWIFRERPELASRVILMTGDNMLNSADYDERLTVIRKPVDIDLFTNEISRLFTGWKG